MYIYAQMYKYIDFEMLGILQVLDENNLYHSMNTTMSATIIVCFRIRIENSHPCN